MRYWHGQAKAAPKAEAAETPAESGEEPDLLDMIGNKGGGKKLAAYLAKQGFVSGADVDKRVDERAAQMVRESKLVEQFPDLSDNSSAFFKDTAKEYGRLIKDGMPKPLAMEQAARNVRLTQLESGDDAVAVPKKKQEEAERLRRVKAQGGDKGQRSAPNTENEDLTAEQKQICAAMGISEENYKKRAKEGVQFAGR